METSEASALVRQRMLEHRCATCGTPLSSHQLWFCNRCEESAGTCVACGESTPPGYSRCYYHQKELTL